MGLYQATENNGGNACYILSVGDQKDSAVRQAQLEEILNLVQAQGGDIMGHEIYHLNKMIPSTFIGKGISQEVASRAHACQANMLVIDAELSPSQMRNLEDVAGIAICDREAIILNVFLRHARTRRARVQVEIAQLEYLRPRIRGIGINMDQQAGGIGGSRGPGETASELLARKLDGRLTALRKMEKKLRQCRETQSQQRRRCQRVVLVGYTNAGKTALMNALTSAELSSRDRPFETLDTTSRSLSRHGTEVVLSDTVGFVRRLPESLLASFESTLAEICEASLLLIVIDLSDYEWQQHMQTNESMIEKLGAQAIARHYVFNKADCLSTTPDKECLQKLCRDYSFTVMSSRDQKAVSILKQSVLNAVCDRTQLLFVRYEDKQSLSSIYRQCRVLNSESKPRGLLLRVQGDPQDIATIKANLQE